MGKWSFLGEFKLQKNCNQCSSKIFFGLVEMPEWQAVELTFFAPSSLNIVSFVFSLWIMWIVIEFLNKSVKIVSLIIFCVFLSEWWTAARDWKERDWSGTKISEIYVYVLTNETLETLRSDHGGGNEHVKKAIGFNRCGHTSDLPVGKKLLPKGKQLFVCGQFPQGEIASGKFP